MAPETNRIRPYAPGRTQQAREALSEGYQQAEHIVQDYPASAVLVTFGVGFALGYLATALLTPPRRTWQQTATSTTNQLGKRISDAVMSALPESISRHL